MSLRKIAVILGLALSVACSAAGRKPIYVSWIPAVSSLKPGSKPTVRITLDLAPAVDTEVSLSTDNPAVSLPGATVTATAGNRYVSVPITLLGVDSDSNVHVTATLNGVSCNSPAMLIPRAKLSRVTFNTSPALNTLVGGAVVELKLTLDGLAGPSGVQVNTGGWGYFGSYSEYQTMLNAVMASDLLVRSGQSIQRTSVSVPTGITNTFLSLFWTTNVFQYTGCTFAVSP